MVGVPSAKRVNNPTKSQQSNEKPFNRQLKRRDCGFFELPRQGVRGSRPRHGLMALGTSTLLLACRPLSSSPGRRGRFAPMPMRSDRAILLVFPPRFVGSARTSKKPRKSAATKNGVASRPGDRLGVPPAPKAARQKPARPTPLQLGPNNRQGHRRWGRRRESRRPDFRQRSAFRQNPGRRRGRGKRSRKRKRDAAASAQAPRPGPAPRSPLRPLRPRRAWRALRARRARGARCGATQAG